MSRRSQRESKKVIYEDFVEGDELDEQPRQRRKSSSRKAVAAGLNIVDNIRLYTYIELIGRMFGNNVNYILAYS